MVAAMVVVGGVGHITELLLHLLFGYLFGCCLGSYSGPGIVLGSYSVYDFIRERHIPSLNISQGYYARYLTFDSRALEYA
jgi:hypothetical protein